MYFVSRVVMQPPLSTPVCVRDLLQVEEAPPLDPVPQAEDPLERVTRGMAFIEELASLEIAHDEYEHAALVYVIQAEHAILQRRCDAEHATESGECLTVADNAREKITALSHIHDTCDESPDIDRISAVHRDLQTYVHATRTCSKLASTVHADTVLRAVASGSFVNFVLNAATGFGILNVSHVVPIMMYLNWRDSHQQQAEKIEGAILKTGGAVVGVGTDGLRTVASTIARQIAGIQERRQLYERRQKLEKSRMQQAWLVSMGAAAVPGSHDVKQRTDTLKEFRAYLDNSQRRLQSSLSGLNRGLGGLVCEAVDERSRVKRMRTDHAERLEKSKDVYALLQIDNAYVQWLGQMGHFVSDTIQMVQTQSQTNSSFAEQVAALSGVSMDALVSGQGSNKSILVKLRKLERELRADESDAHAYVTQSAAALVAPVLVAPVLPPKNKAAMFSINVYDAAAVTRAWNTLIWTGCFDLGPDPTRLDLGFTQPVYAASDTFTPRLSVTLGKKDLRRWDMCAFYNEIMTTGEAEKAIDARAKKENGASTERTSLESADRAALAGVVDSVIQLPELKRLLVHALRLRAREHNRGPITELLSDFPTRATLSPDCRDYDVFAWTSMFRTNADQPRHPPRISLPVLTYIAMMQDIEEGLARGAAAKGDEGTAAAHAINRRRVRVAAGDHVSNPMKDWQIISTAGVPETFSLTTPSRYNINGSVADTITSGYQYAAASGVPRFACEHVDDTHAQQDHGVTGEWVAPRFNSDIDTSSRTRLRRNIKHIVPPTDQTPSVIPDYYELCDPLGAQTGHRPDLLLMTDHLEYDFGIRVWLQALDTPLIAAATAAATAKATVDTTGTVASVIEIIGNCWKRIQGITTAAGAADVADISSPPLLLPYVFWPVFMEHVPTPMYTLFRTCTMQVQENLVYFEARLSVTGAESKIFLVQVAPTVIEYDMGELSPDTRARLRRLHMMRVSAERDLLWTSAADAAAPYLVEGDMDIESVTTNRRVAWGSFSNIPLLDMMAVGKPFNDPVSRNDNQTTDDADTRRYSSFTTSTATAAAELIAEMTRINNMVWPSTSAQVPSSILQNLCAVDMATAIQQSHIWFVGDVVSIRHRGEWAQTSHASAGDYGVCREMYTRVDDWFVSRCWASMPTGFKQWLKNELLMPHLLGLLDQRRATLREEARDNECIKFFGMTLDSGNPILAMAEQQRTHTLVFQMASKVATDIQRTFSEHLMDDAYGAALLMNPTRSDFYSNFYSLVAFEVMYHRRMNGIRTTYAGDARRQQQEYRLHKYVFRNARIHRYVSDAMSSTQEAYIVDVSLPSASRVIHKGDHKVSLVGHPLQAIERLMYMITK